MNEFLPQAKIAQKDLFELDFKDLIDFDIIIDAFGEWEKLSLHKKHIE
ncbi:NADH-flavin reductase, partial [Campylobacter jejuni]|nr:NADH-flavin reductase [Campylobacter jejuni]